MKIERRAGQIVPLVEGPRVLHVGCAAHEPDPNDPTWLHGQLVKHFPDAVGVDLREDLIEQLRSLGYKNLYVANAETFDLGQEFDTIVAGDIIEHLSNPGLFLERARHHLAKGSPGGKLIITTPYPFCLQAMAYAFLKYPRTCFNNEHTSWFCLRTFGELVRRSDLHIQQWDLIGSYSAENDSIGYRLGVAFFRYFGWLVPKKLKCNTMLFVLTRSEQSGNLAYRKDAMTGRN